MWLTEVNPQLNVITTWLEVRELHDVVGEVLAKLIQHYGYQLLSHKRWDEAFEDFGREDAAKCVLADATMLEAQYTELMADADGKETRKWQQIKTYIVAPLRAYNTNISRTHMPVAVFTAGPLPLIAALSLDNAGSIGELMAAGQEGWMERATKELDMYDAARAARAHPVWQLDELAPACQICREEFGFLLRRHHCRYCGFVVCDPCRRPLAVDRWLSASEPHSIKISTSGRVEKEVCKSCFEHAPAEMDDLSGWRGVLSVLRGRD